MGLHRTKSTIPGGLTPICNECGVSLCWDISGAEADEHRTFWDAWRCQDCNGGVPMRRRPSNRMPTSRLTGGDDA